MGFTRLEDIVGRTDLIEIAPREAGSKEALLDFSRILCRVNNDSALCHVSGQLHEIDHVMDRELISASFAELEKSGDVTLEYTVANTDRSVGAMLSGEVVSRYGQAGLGKRSLHITFHGSAGQSFGAFLVPGIHFRLEGEANDYLGKGLSGGAITVCPPREATFRAEENVIAGNTLLYGATSGEVYINGQVGERFAVRNSGAVAVVEGVGDHCCEYMTGGCVVVLGSTGRNFAAGMSGGVAYVWDPDRNFDYFCNMEMVELSLVEDKASREELHELVRKHYFQTGSSLAHSLLNHWERSLGEFVRVIPFEYKKRLAEASRMRESREEMQSVY